MRLKASKMNSIEIIFKFYLPHSGIKRGYFRGVVKTSLEKSYPIGEI